MQTYDEILDDLKSYAEKSNINGIAVDTMCNLLAYSLYKNQTLQLKTTLESSFSTSSLLNSRIHHAADMLYEVYRGRCPYLDIQNIKSPKDGVAKKLDECMSFNGYYFYFMETKPLEHDAGVTGGLQLLCSDVRALEKTIKTNDNLYFVDFIDKDISEDFIIFYTSGENKRVELRTTNDFADLYSKDVRVNPDGTTTTFYKYDVLIVTLPDYGLRVIRRSDGSEGWVSSELSIRYLHYNEKLPDLSRLKSITGFVLEDSRTNIFPVAFKPREDNLDRIYLNAIRVANLGKTIATEDDLQAALHHEGSPDVDASYRFVISDSEKPDKTGPSVVNVYYRSLNESVTELKVSNFLNEYAKSIDITESFLAFKAKAKTVPGITHYIRAYSDTQKLSSETLAYMLNQYSMRIGESVPSSLIEADIVRMGFDRVRILDGNTSSAKEISFECDCKPNEYPNINLQLYTGD